MTVLVRFIVAFHLNQIPWLQLLNSETSPTYLNTLREWFMHNSLRVP